ncbi:Uncharacterised protein [uncultured archaeon]|nr:Uncharacterised protein [uncultured archaeon]
MATLNFDGSKLYRAKGTPKLPPKVALALLNQSARTSSRSLYDPFCGGGTILLCARKYFPNHYLTISGADIDPLAVEATRLNLLDSIPETELLQNIVPRDATKDTLPTGTDLIVTDPPFGRRCPVSEGFLEKAFLNFRNQNVQDIFFCYDGKTPLQNELKRIYTVKEFKRDWGRAFYHAQAK